MNDKQRLHIGVLLAAGAGTRFGGAYAGAKLDQLIDGVSVGVRSFENLAKAVDAMVVVVRDESSALASHARSRGATVIVNSEPERGLGRSLALAAQHALATYTNAQFLWATLADMPCIEKNTFDLLRTEKLGDTSNNSYKIFQPMYVAALHAHVGTRAREQHGKPGHPVVFGRAHWAALAALDGDVGARAVIAANREHLVCIETNDEGVWRDIDTPLDLRRIE
jgi:molybdenum cofactor cytidylyltransferase